MKQLAILALASTLAFAASAQERAGVIDGVKGAVTVSSAKAIKRAVNGMAVPDGASILVPSDGAATVLLGSGCVVSLQGSQHLRVDAKLKCDQLQASVKQLFPAYQLAQAPLGGGIVGIPAAGAKDEDCKDDKGARKSDDKRCAVPVWWGSGGNVAAAGMTTLTAVAALTDWNRRDNQAVSGQ